MVKLRPLRKRLNFAIIRHRQKIEEEPHNIEAKGLKAIGLNIIAWEEEAMVTEPNTGTQTLEKPKVENPKKSKEEKAVNPNPERTLAPKDLAAKLGLSPKRLRAMLRAERPRALEVKGKRWEIPTSVAKEVEKAYKAKKAKAQAEKTAQIQKELKGEAK